MNGIYIQQYSMINMKWVASRNINIDLSFVSFLDYSVTWWRYQMETYSALLALCTGNSPVNGEFPTHRPVTRSFDGFFDLRLNKRLRKQWWGWWFETPSRPLWRHCNEYQVCCFPGDLRSQDNSRNDIDLVYGEFPIVCAGRVMVEFNIFIFIWGSSWSMTRVYNYETEAENEINESNLKLYKTTTHITSSAPVLEWRK